MRETVDFHYVPPHQTAIHERLRNWSRWVRVRPHGWQTHPMWRKALTSRQWDTDPHIHVECDTLDALLIERTVSKLPEQHRGAIRWYYVSGHNPQGMARSVGASCSGLLELVCTGRTMVGNVAR